MKKTTGITYPEAKKGILSIAQVFFGRTTMPPLRVISETLGETKRGELMDRLQEELHIVLTKDEIGQIVTIQNLIDVVAQKLRS